MNYCICNSCKLTSYFLLDDDRTYDSERPITRMCPYCVMWGEIYWSAGRAFLGKASKTYWNNYREHYPTAYANGLRIIEDMFMKKGMYG